MAGFYGDVPAHRFALDIDGTVFKRLDAAKTVITDASAAATLISDTDSDYYQLEAGSWLGSALRGYFVVIFPELRNLDSHFIALSGSYADGKELEYSSDTTDGLDGTWTVATSNWAHQTTLSPNYRTSITSQPISNVKAFRFGWGYSSHQGSQQFRIACMHLYGSIVGGENPDRLRFWHDTLDQEAGPAHFDFGDVPVGTQSTVAFRVKNNSTTLTANSINLVKESASYADVDAGLEFSSDDSSYFTTLNIGNLAPGAISPVVYLRRTFDAGEATSIPKVGRLTATADTWS